MMYPEVRLRRLRQDERIRNLVCETRLHKDQLILPVFFDETLSETRSTDSMPGVPTHSLSGFDGIASRIQESGVGSVLVFGIPAEKDAVGSGAYRRDGVVQKAIAGLKESSDLLVIADLCLCEYTDHGHCGVLDGCGHVVNDDTIELYARTAVSQAEAGADIIAPSGMMDGQVAAIREALDDAGFRSVPIMAYSAKFQSAYYGPFRDIAESAPGKGDRAGYQMAWGNRREAMREIELDVAEGADMIMVKPAGPYLDVIREAADRFDLPLAAYQVSGEYAMIKAAAANGWIDEQRVMRESLIGIRRAGADMIITYFAEDMARMLRSHGPFRDALQGGGEALPRRGQQSRPQVRSVSVVHIEGTWEQGDGCRRPLLHRPVHGIRPSDHRTCASGGHGGGPLRHRGRHSLRRPVRARARSYQKDHRSGAVRGDGPSRQFRDGGHHARDTHRQRILRQGCRRED